MRKDLHLFLAVLFPVICTVSCGGGRPSAVEQRPAAVRVRAANRLERPVRIAASGSVEARDTIETGFKVAGRVARVFVQEGDAVRRGQPLAELDAADYQHALDAAAAQAGAARAAMDKADAGARPEELEQARIGFARAQDEYDRMRQLYERKSLAANDFRKFEAAYLVARERYQEAKAGARPEDRRAARAMLDQARAGELVARDRLGDARLTAPANGFLGRRMVDPGEMVAAGMPVFVILDLNPAKVRVGVPEAEIGRVRLGQRTAVRLPSLPEKSFEGRVSLVGVSADPVSRTYTVKIDVANPHTVLRAGMIAEVEIDGDTMNRALTLPGQAVVRDPQGATLVYVFFPAQKRVYARRVELGTVYDTEVEIRSGLTGDERVVVAGQSHLRDGEPVEAAEDPAPPAPAKGGRP
jgi:multidrug efflux pump subunit AcrA (membrane-fusion protein)